MTVLFGRLQSRLLAPIVPSVRPCTMREKQVNDFLMSLRCGLFERRITLKRSVGIRTHCEERSHLNDISLFSRDYQRLIQKHILAHRNCRQQRHGYYEKRAGITEQLRWLLLTDIEEPRDYRDRPKEDTE